ncbi:MAG: hypothetical protein ACRDYD_12835 [Acidimicrobiales bacterium]
MRPPPGRPRLLRGLLLGAVVAVVAQAAVGMVVNLYVAVPSHHPGAQPSSYLAGSYDSVTWVIGNGTAAVAAHAALGLALVVFAVVAAVASLRLARRAVAAWTVLGGALVVGAGFNGASFLDFNRDASSLIMALLALAAIASYAVALYLLGTSPS